MAGLPATTIFGIISFVTTDPAPITEPLPIVKPPNIVALLPMETLSPIFVSINLGNQSASFSISPDSLVLRGYLSFIKTTP